MVNVRKKKNIQTDPCRLSESLSDLQLNKEETLSVVDFKTLSNSSRGSRKSDAALTQKTSHNGTCSPKHRVSQENVVFVLNKNGKTLMPTKSGKARRMLKAGIAKVVSRTPFVIKMLVNTCEYKQTVTAGMDTGSKVIGVAAVANGKTIYQSEVHLRGDEIKRKMEQRAMYRRTRRGRKTRYRKPRFLNRGASIKEGRLAHSVRHKVECHFREKRFLESILPISDWFVETANFDTALIANDNALLFGKDYQNGRKKGFQNTKQYVLHRDKYTCQKCKEKDTKFEVHHIVFRSKGGSDSPDNLVTLCGPCHKKIHAHKDAEKESLKLQKVAQKKTKDATQVSIVRSQLLKSDWNFVDTFGYETKFNRQTQGLPKEHRIDAVMIATQGEVVEIGGDVLVKRMVSKGDYQQTKGPRSNIKIPTGKLFGFRKFDLIKTSRGTGFIKGKRSSGFFAIADIEGKVISASVNVKKGATRVSTRKVSIKQYLKRGAFPPQLKQEGLQRPKVIG